MIWFAYRNTPKDPINVEEIVHNVKEYEESESDYNPEQQKMIARKNNRLLRFSMGQGDWNIRRNSLMEDLIAGNTGFPSPNKLEMSITQPRGRSLRKMSFPLNITKRFSQAPGQRISGTGEKTSRHHKRGLSLFDNDNIMSIGLGGQPASNLFQIHERPTTDVKLNRRAKSIFH
jgi:hypothetical protein